MSIFLISFEALNYLNLILQSLLHWRLVEFAKEITPVSSDFEGYIQLWKLSRRECRLLVIFQWKEQLSSSLLH